MKKSLALLAAGALIMLPAGPATAAPPSPPPPVDGLVGPLHVSAGTGNSVIVSEEFAGRLTRIEGGTKTELYAPPVDEQWDVAGTATQGSTTYAVESQGAGPEDPRPLAGHLVAVDAMGRTTTITDQIGAYETTQNPDGDVHYGLGPNAPAECSSQLTSLGFPASYTGETDSHPYALAVRGNTAYVADAGGNDVLAVNLSTGAIQTVAVLPPRPATITQDFAEQYGLPACIGQTYNFEPVPTDVAIGSDGWLYVTSLPGGPEDASLGARGAVFRVSPSTGAVQPWIQGIMSPTGLAFDGSGNLYIASLFGTGVLRAAAGTQTAKPFLDKPFTADVTIQGNMLYATTDVFGNGTLIAQKLTH